MLFLGFDIGTTSICAVVLDEAGREIFTANRRNDTFIKSAKIFEKIQDPDKIISICMELYSEMLKKYPAIHGIGVTGQMHGILYVDGGGEAVSPLYTWQDGRGDLTMPNSQETYAQKLTKAASEPVYSGYGSVTHFYNTFNELVPPKANKLCTIGDYLVMKLTGSRAPLIHPTNAHSIGLYNKKTREFEVEDRWIFPGVKDGFSVIGETPEKIPVTIATGDNQAAVFAAMTENSVFVNIGTGGQFACITDKPLVVQGIENRPFFHDKNLAVGASLCGGRAYAILEKFFRSVVELANGGKSVILYDRMEESMKNWDFSRQPLLVDTRFGGTRENPDIRGSITNIGEDNFMAQNLIAGTLDGIARELHDFYLRVLPHLDKSPSLLVGSGNGLRKNKLLQEFLKNKFDLPFALSPYEEEAAAGAALFARAALNIR